MPFVEDVNRLLRDHVGYSGDGQGGTGPLPVGDRNTAQHEVAKRDLRELLIQMAQTMGDPSALDELRSAIDLNAVKFYDNRQQAIDRGANLLPTGIVRIMTVEAWGVAVRARNSTEDALYDTAPRWGISHRLATQAFVDAAFAVAIQRANQTGTQPISTVDGLSAALQGLSDAIAAGDTALASALNQNGVKLYDNAAQAVANGANALPSGIVRIMTIESWGVAVRSRNTTTDALYGTVPYWGISRRLTSEEAVIALIEAEAEARDTAIVAAIADEAGARASGDVASRQRANHTGLQPISTVDGLPPALQGLSQARIDGDAAEAAARQQAIAAEVVLRNAAIAAGDATEAAARVAGDAAEAAARQIAVAAERTARLADVDILSRRQTAETRSRVDDVARIDTQLADPVHRVTMVPRNRPGDAPWLFSTDYRRASPYDMPALELTAGSPTGRVGRLIGRGFVAPRSRFGLEYGRTYRARFVVQLAVDPADPSGDAVRLEVAWFNRDGVLIATSVAHTYDDLRVADGRQEFSIEISHLAGAALMAPAGARYARPFVNSFAAEPSEVHVEIIDWTDMTGSAVWSPEVSEFVGRVSALESLGLDARLQSVEQEVAFPTQVWARSRAEAQTLFIAPTVERIYCPSPDGNGILVYIRDPDGTALETADGTLWSPLGDATPPHFGSDSTGQTLCDFPFWLFLDYLQRNPAAQGLVRGRYRISTDFPITAPIKLDLTGATIVQTVAPYGFLQLRAGSGRSVVENLRVEADPYLIRPVYTTMYRGYNLAQRHCALWVESGSNKLTGIASEGMFNTLCVRGPVEWDLGSDTYTGAEDDPATAYDWSGFADDNVIFDVYGDTQDFVVTGHQQRNLRLDVYTGKDIIKRNDIPTHVMYMRSHGGRCVGCKITGGHCYGSFDGVAHKAHDFIGSYFSVMSSHGASGVTNFIDCRDCSWAIVDGTGMRGDNSQARYAHNFGGCSGRIDSLSSVADEPNTIGLLNIEDGKLPSDLTLGGFRAVVNFTLSLGVSCRAIRAAGNTRLTVEGGNYVNLGDQPAPILTAADNAIIFAADIVSRGPASLSAIAGAGIVRVRCDPAKMEGWPLIYTVGTSIVLEEQTQQYEHGPNINLYAHSGSIVLPTFTSRRCFTDRRGPRVSCYINMRVNGVVPGANADPIRIGPLPYDVSYGTGVPFIDVVELVARGDQITIPTGSVLVAFAPRGERYIVLQTLKDGVRTNLRRDALGSNADVMLTLDYFTTDPL